MKIACKDEGTINEHYSLVDDGYDFNSNPETDESSIENWDTYGIDIGAKNSEIVIEIDLLVTSKGFNSCTDKEQIVASCWFVVLEAQRDTVHSESEQRVYADRFYLRTKTEEKQDFIDNITNDKLK